MKSAQQGQSLFGMGTIAFYTSLGLALLLTACSSPEAKRVRGGDSGADVGNRRPNIEMYAGS